MYLKRATVSSPRLGNFVNPASHRRDPVFNRPILKREPSRYVYSAKPMPVGNKLHGCEGNCAPRGRAFRNNQMDGFFRNNSLDGFFSSVIDSVKRSITQPVKAVVDLVSHGPGAFVADIKTSISDTKNDIATMGGVIAPIVSFIPGVGPIVGPALKMVSAKFQADIAKGKQLAQAAASGSQANLIAAYVQIAGQAAGRFYGLDALRAVLNSAYGQNAIPGSVIDGKGTRKVWTDMAADFIYPDTGKCVTNSYSCVNGLLPLAKANPTASADQIVTMYAKTNPLPAPDILGNALQHQIFLDIADAALASVNPNSPITYGIAASDLEPVNPAPQTIATSSSAPQIPTSGFTGGMTTTAQVQPAPASSLDVAKINAQNDAAHALQAMAAMQDDVAQLRAQLLAAQATGNAAKAADTAAQLQALQTQQAQTAASYTGYVQQAQPMGVDPAQIAALVSMQLQNSGVTPNGAVAAGINAGANVNPTIFGVPQNVVLIAAGGLALFLVMRARRAR